MDAALSQKYARLKAIITGYGSVTVAFSGGVDSTLLLKVAVDLLQGDAVAYFADSQVQLPGEAESCRRLASSLGAELAVFELDLLHDHHFCANVPDRCYYCKHKVYSQFIEHLHHRGGGVLVDGTNLDDNDALRPGSRAVLELGVGTPLRDAGFGKRDIRRLSQELGLPTWDKHSASCLATRVPTGLAITADKLRIIRQGEEILAQAHLPGCRLRLHENYAVIELGAGGLTRFIEEGVYRKVVRFLKTEGSRQVFLDLSEREGILS